jgi:type II secretion system protein G
MQIKKGFTLIEIIIVISIIGLIATIGMSSYSILNKNARDARRKADLEQVRSALELYRSNNGTYPTTNSAWYGTCTAGWATVTSDYVPNLVADGYIQKLPQDPRNGQSFSPCNDGGMVCYTYISNGIDFKLIAVCGAEIPPNSNDDYYDPGAGGIRKTHSYQISSSNTSLQW